MNKRNDVTVYLENISIILFCVFLIGFPLIYSTITTDLYLLPKQIFLGIVSLLSLILFAARTISEKAIRIRRTPFDIPLLLFTIFAFLSAFFAINKFDSYMAFVPLFFGVTMYFMITNGARTQLHVFSLMSSFIAGGVLSSLVIITSYFKIYILPIQLTYEKAFNIPFNSVGSLLDLAIYLTAVFLTTIYLVIPLLKAKSSSEIKGKNILFLLASLIIVVAIGTTLFQLTKNRPVILPYETGFQTAFAAVSQDQGRTLQGFLLGGGYGTYSSVFTRFKQASFNENQLLWAIQTFTHSSSYVLELLATTGILGLGAFLFLISRILRQVMHTTKATKKNPLIFSIILVGILSFILPLSFTIQTILLIVLALFSAEHGLHEVKGYYDVILYIVASKKSLLPISTYPVEDGAHEGVYRSISSQKIHEDEHFTKFLPVSLFIVILILAGYLGFHTYNYALSDITFQKSLTTPREQGLDIYNQQLKAINLFPWRDGYYRVFSQTNLALADSIARSTQNSSPSADVQKNLLQFVQQSINSGRLATSTSPLTSANWQNLSSIYRSLIGFGQNAEQFAILSSRQAAVLDPSNPQQYINLGGIYLQLKQYEDAQAQFQLAVRLKPDYANAYYNLGYTLEQKGDFPNALAMYQAVKNLLKDDKANIEKIDADIARVSEKVGNTSQLPGESQIQTPEGTQDNPPTPQPTINISSPSAQLPSQRNKVDLPPPSDSATRSAE